MQLRKAIKSDQNILYDMLNFNKYDCMVDKNEFDEIFSSNLDQFKVLLYNNLRIGMVFDKQFFINPIYWEKLSLKEIEEIWDSI